MMDPNYGVNVYWWMHNNLKLAQPYLLIFAIIYDMSKYGQALPVNFDILCGMTQEPKEKVQEMLDELEEEMFILAHRNKDAVYYEASPLCTSMKRKKVFYGKYGEK